MKELTLLIILGFLLFLLGIIVSFASSSVYQLIKSNSNIKLNDSNCSGMDLLFTAQCLRDELKPIYKFNISQVGKTLTDEELAKDGGVCSNFADWYNKRATELGFYSNHVVIQINNNTAHGFDVIANNEGYCILDQMNYHCQMLDANYTGGLNES